MSIEIKEPWARMQEAGSQEAAGFVTLLNSGPEPDRLVSASADIAEKTEIWGIRVVGPGMRMCLYENGLKLPVDMAIQLKPRGYHLYFQGLRQPLIQGRKMPVTLQFEKAPAQTVELEIKAPGPVGPDVLGHV